MIKIIGLNKFIELLTDLPTRYTIQKLNPNQTGVNFGTVDPNTPPYNHSLYRELLNQVFI